MAFKVAFDVDSANSSIKTVQENLTSVATKANKLSKDLESIASSMQKVVPPAMAVKSAADKANKSLDQQSKNLKDIEATKKAAAEKNLRLEKARAESALRITAWGIKNRLSLLARAERRISDAVVAAEKETTARVLAETKSREDRRLAVQIAARKREARMKSGAGFFKLSKEENKINSGYYVGLERKARKAAEAQRSLASSSKRVSTAFAKEHEEALKMNAAYDKKKKKAAELKAKQDELSVSTLRAAKSSAAFRAAMNALGTHMGIFTGKTVLVAAAVYSTISAFKSMVSTGIAYTDQMARALPIMGATASQSAMLEKEVRRLGETTIFTSTEVAGGLTALAMAGLSASQALDALAPALQLASIGQVDMYQSADFLTNVMNGFRLTAQDIPDIVDDLATSVTSSNATITQMAGALSYVAPIATAAGASIEEVTAILEVFHNAGIKGSRAGTSLRRAYSNLMKPSADAAKVFDRLGISTKDANGYMLEMTNIMKQLADKGAVASDIIDIFGVRASPAMTALLQDLKGVSSEFEIFRANLEANEGSAEALQKKMENTFGGDIKKLISALAEKSNELFKNLTDGFRSVTQEATEFIKSISKETIKDIADSLRSIGSVLKFIAGFAAAAAKIYLTIKAFKLLGNTLIFVNAQYVRLKASTIAAEASAAGMALTTALLGKNLTAAATSATVFGTALKVAVPWLGLIATAVGVAWAAYDHYADSTENAKDKVKELTEAEKERARLKENAQNSAKQIIKFVDNGGKAAKSPAEQRLIKEKVAAKLHIKEVEQTTTELTNAYLKRGVFTKEALTTYEAQLEVNAQRLKDAYKNLEDIEKEYATFLKTGHDKQGLKNIAEFQKAFAAISDKGYTAKITNEFSSLSNTLSELKFEEKLGSITDEQGYLARIQAIDSSHKALTGYLKEQIKSTEISLEEAKTNETKLELEEKRVKLVDALTNAENRYNKNRIKAKDDFLGGNRLAELVANANKQIQLKKEELELVRKGSKDKDDAFARELEGTADVLQAKIESQKVQGTLSKSEYDRITLVIEKLREKASAHREVTAAILAEEKAQNDRKKLQADFNSGKGFSKEDKAQREYDLRIAQLDAYVTLHEGMKKTDDWYVNAKLEADQKLIESQHEVAFSLSDSMSKAVGDNVAKVALLDQTWEESSRNIRRAIVGGIVGALVQYAVKETSNFLLHKLFQKKKEKDINKLSQLTIQKNTAELASTAAVTAAKVAGDKTVTTSATTSASTQVGASNSVTQAKMMEGIANQASGDPYSAFGRIAAMTAIMAGIQALVSGIMSGISGTREIGGPVTAGQSYLVGERGAEIFTPTTSGAITSNADVKRSLNSGSSVGENHYYAGDTVNIEIKALDSQDVRRALAKESDFLSALRDKDDRRRARVTRR